MSANVGLSKANHITEPHIKNGGYYTLPSVNPYQTMWPESVSVDQGDTFLLWK